MNVGTPVGRAEGLLLGTPVGTGVGPGVVGSAVSSFGAARSSDATSICLIHTASSARVSFVFIIGWINRFHCAILALSHLRLTYIT